MESVSWSKVQCKGIMPPASFGHTAVKISKNLIVLFGGASSSDGKYIMTSDTYLYDIIKSEWSLIKGIFTYC